MLKSIGLAIALLSTHSIEKEDAPAELASAHNERMHQSLSELKAADDPYRRHKKANQSKAYKEEKRAERIYHKAEIKRKKALQLTQSRRTISVEATFYGSDCVGCSGITATGDDVRNGITVNGRRVIAVDPSVIPLRSVVKVTLSSGKSFEAIASDTGGAIKGHIIDILVSSEAESYKHGRQSAVVEIIKNGGGN